MAALTPLRPIARAGLMVVERLPLTVLVLYCGLLALTAYSLDLLVAEVSGLIVPP